MDIFKKFATDEKAELNGTWVDIGDGGSLLIARSDNENFDRAIASTTAENRAALDKGDSAATELDRKLLLDVLSTTILLGWKGLEYASKPIKYSKANAVKLLKHKDFRKLVGKHSSNISNFLMSAEGEDVKN